MMKMSHFGWTLVTWCYYQISIKKQCVKDVKSMVGSDSWTLLLLWLVFMWSPAMWSLNSKITYVLHRQIEHLFVLVILNIRCVYPLKYIVDTHINTYLFAVIHYVRSVPNTHNMPTGWYLSTRLEFPLKIWRKKITDFLWLFPWPGHKFPWPFFAFCKKFYLQHEMIH